MDPHGEMQDRSLPRSPLCFLIMQRLGHTAEIAMKGDHSLWSTAVQVLTAWLTFNSVQNMSHSCRKGENKERMGAIVGKGKSHESFE